MKKFTRQTSGNAPTDDDKSRLRSTRLEGRPPAFDTGCAQADAGRVLFDPITRAILEASMATVVRTDEATRALTKILGIVLSRSPSVTRSPEAIRRMADEVGKQLCRYVAEAKRNGDVQEFAGRTFRDGVTEPSANPTPRDPATVSGAQALAAMCAGQKLHLEYRDFRKHWSLSDGRPVTADEAAILIRDPHVVLVDGALFSDLPGQTWRYQ